MFGDTFAYRVWAIDQELTGIRRYLQQLKVHLEALGPELLGGQHTDHEDPEAYLRAYV